MCIGPEVDDPEETRPTFRRLVTLFGGGGADDMRGFGESGKIAEVYEKFDITTAAVVRAARDSLKSVHGA